MAPTEVDIPVLGCENQLQEESGRKWKKTRRGKKRSRRSAGGATCDKCPLCGCGKMRRGYFLPMENFSAVDRVSSDALKSHSHAETAKSAKRRSGSFLRPAGLYAPENSTQFLIDDHESILYADLVSPKKSRFEVLNDTDTVTPQAQAETGRQDCLKRSPEYSDIDFEYESPDDLDTSSFLEQDFENVLLDLHQEELMTCHRDDLVLRVSNLQKRHNDHENKLSELSTSSDASHNSIRDLLQELELLRAENSRLKEESQLLRNTSSAEHS